MANYSNDYFQHDETTQPDLPHYYYPPQPYGYPPSPPDNNPPQGPSRTRRPAQRRRNGCCSGCLYGCLSIIIAIIVGSIFFSNFAMPIIQQANAFGNAISNQPPFSTQSAYMATSSRTNLLIIGYGGENHEGAELTDSLAIVSLIPTDRHTTLIAIPRDLRVQYPPYSENYMKINAVYENADDGKADHSKAASAITQQASLVTGMSIPFWMTIDFHGFRDFINAIGGIDINVPDAFTANYPKNDNDQIDASMITIHFKAGEQHMNGETAIRYARARYVLDNANEGTDFARSQRQQLIIAAALAKLQPRLQHVSDWPQTLHMMAPLKQAIRTNMSLVDLTLFAQKMDLHGTYGKIGLSTNNVLQEIPGTSDLEPQSGNWQLIPNYIQQNLYQ
jgi:LCP family protein required for cell wall assembly